MECIECTVYRMCMTYFLCIHKNCKAKREKHNKMFTSALTWFATKYHDANTSSQKLDGKYDGALQNIIKYIRVT